ncbi:MAG: hypothetical protein ACYC7E_16685 [Armatimonadota bacterium]
MLLKGLALAMLVLTCLPAAYAASLAKTVTITDYLGIDWQDELVHYPLELPSGALRGAAEVLVASERKALPSQVSDVARYPDGSVKSCTVWFFASVPANGAVSYTLTPGKPGATTAGVKVTTAPAAVTLSTVGAKPIGIRLPNGAKSFDWPIPAGQAPGPIQGLLLPSGKVAGQGKIEAPFLVKSYSTEILATGPLFAEARISYLFDTGYWTFTARVIKGCPTVVIHEEFNTGDSGQLAKDADRFFTLTLAGGGFQPSQFFFGGRNDRPDLATLVTNGLREEWKAFGIRDNWFASNVQGAEIPKGQAQELYRCTAYPSVLARVGCVTRVQEATGDAVGITGLDTAYWREPLSIRLRATAAGEAQLCFPLQDYKQDWPIDGFGDGSPNYTGVTLYVPKHTARRAYGLMLSPATDEKTELLQSLFTQARRLDPGALPLDTVKDMTLNWPDPLAKEAWATASSEKGKKALEIMRTRLNVTRALGQWARFSMAYHYSYAKADYPVVKEVLDSPKDLSAADRVTMRRLCAWNAYDMNSESTFPFGMGFHLNNPNMSVMAVEARAKSSLLVQDHPMFKPWGTWTLAFLKDFNRRFTRASGALYENPHYSLGVTLDWQAQANKILMDAGIGDAFDTPLFAKGIRFCLDWLSPPDPRFLGHRVVLPMGNCSYQSIPPSMATQYITYFKERNPELAGQLQWAANQTLPKDKQIAIVKDIVPQLKSTWYKDYGVYMRHGFGTPYETLLLLYAGNCDGHYEWEQDQMSYTLYAKGQPINLHFGNGYFPMFGRTWLRNRVSIDHMFEESERNVTQVRTAAFAPAMEYAHATREIDSLRPFKTEYPILKGSAWTPEESENMPAMPVWQRIPMTVWHRQVLFLKDTDPKGPNYFVLRETFSGTPTRPTDLSLWFLANSMTRKGDVFHFDGQCLVDMDVFVSTPAGTEPETGKYGHVQQPYVRMVGFDPKFHPDGKLQETQLFLRLKQPAGKGYLVVLYPRLKAGDPEAVCTTLADGVVKVDTPLSSDYAFVNSVPFAFTDARVSFRGTAGSVRFYADNQIVVTNAEGQAEYKVSGKTITGTGAFTVTIGKDGVKTEKGEGASVEVK